MSQSGQHSHSSITWIIGVLIVVCLVTVLYFTVQILVGGPSRGVMLTKPEAGGLAMPTATPTRPAAQEAAAASTPSADLTLPTPGQGVVGKAVSSQAYVLLRADAGYASLVMDAFDDGSAFVVLEPSGDYAGYPVEHDDTRWVRVRAADGLVGWLDEAQISSVSFIGDVLAR